MNTVRTAFRKSLPVMAGYIILGTGFGILAHRAGYGFLSRHMGNVVSVGGSILVGVVVYAILVVVLRVVSRDDLSLMPKGDKIAKLLHIR